MCPEKFISQRKRDTVLFQLTDRTLRANAGRVLYFQGDETFKKEGWVNFITDKGVIAVSTYRNGIVKGLITKLHCDSEQAKQIQAEGIMEFSKSELKK
jgi:hypothetical protein